MKILAVSNFFPPHFVGGAEIVAHQQALALMGRGHDVRVFAGDTNSRGAVHYQRKEELVDALQVYRITLRPADFDPVGNNVAHAPVDRYFSDIIAEWRPDVVHAHHLVGLSLGILAIARERGIPVVLTLHDHWGFCVNSTRITTQGLLCQDSSQCEKCHSHIREGEARFPMRMRQDFVRWQLSNVDQFISPSHYLAGTYIDNGIPTSKINVVANGIKLDRFASIAPSDTNGRLRLLFIGYLGAHKGVHILLEALALLSEKHCIHVDFVGDGHERLSYENEANIIAIESKSNLSCRFWGRLPNSQIDRLYARAQVFVLPSICPENQPVTITEAMASGLPVVASCIGGIPELVVDGVTGYLARHSDAPDLAEKISFYLTEPGLITKHGQAAREFIRGLEFGRQIDLIEALLSQTASAERSNESKVPIIATLGEPPTAVFRQLLADLAGTQLWGAEAARCMRPPQPFWIPAHWVEPSQVSFLWVTGREGASSPLAACLISQYCAAGVTIIMDECAVYIEKTVTIERILIVRGPLQTSVAQTLLLAHPNLRLVSS